MSEIIIQTDHLTKDYGKGRGIFDVSLDIRRGEVYGYIGTNGSGKTTTIRHLIGFLQADAGNATVMGMDTWKDSLKIKPYMSYVPGEIAFPGLKTGTDFLKLQAEYLGITDYTYMNKLIQMLQLDPTANLKRMSKGMKQKTALVAALMGDRDILVLDEPTTGLDPLMRDVFLELIREEKAKGKTIFMSSHIFEEIESVCDRAAMIKDGHITNVLDVYNLRHKKNKHYIAEFKDKTDAIKFANQCQYAKCELNQNICHIYIEMTSTPKLLKHLSEYPLLSLSEKRENLETTFYKEFAKGVNEHGK